jgi:hypothetical protein
VNTVNTVGVMGKGVALEFKQRFPDGYEEDPRHPLAPFGTPPVELTPDFLGHAPTGIEASGVDEDGR